VFDIELGSPVAGPDSCTNYSLSLSRTRDQDHRKALKNAAAGTLVNHVSQICRPSDNLELAVRAAVTEGGLAQRYYL
jgi:hypothetical protein